MKINQKISQIFYPAIIQRRGSETRRTSIVQPKTAVDQTQALARVGIVSSVGKSSKAAKTPPLPALDVPFFETDLFPPLIKRRKFKEVKEPKKKKKKKRLGVSGVTPTLFSSVLNIKSSKFKTSDFTGLEIRPIPIK